MNRFRVIFGVIWGVISRRSFLSSGLALGLWLQGPIVAAQNARQSVATAAQVSAVERTFALPKIKVEKALKELQASLSGRLPALDGFAVEGQHPLSRYQRGYYQSSVQIVPAAGGGSTVRVTTKVTAWYADKTAGRSGYQLLTSNGRLEADLLDQISDVLGNTVSATSADGASGSAASGSAASGTAREPAPSSTTSQTAATKNENHGSDWSAISAPGPRSGKSAPFASPQQSPSHSPSQSVGLSRDQLAETKGAQRLPGSSSGNTLQAQAAALEEVLKNQAHPKNLVAIKKSGTPVVATPSLSGKTLFMASAEDEFEMLDFNADWVHVRISGLSRGWIWRTSLEMPEGISDVPKVAATGAGVIADLFQVSREETAPFPGDWAPLRGKNVKIISVQKIQENSTNSGPQAKLEYTKSLLEKSYAELSSKGQELAGIVLIFDSIDGGMIAATLPTVRAWKAGTLSDAALWHQCYFDPPETFTVSSSPSPGAGQ